MAWRARLNAPVQWTRRHLGFGLWSLSSYLKLKVKTAVNFVGEFEHELIEEARRRGVDGVVCGHIHHAAKRDVGGIQYLNCGDWVESCTAIAEDAAGRLQIVAGSRSCASGSSPRQRRLACREPA